MDIGNAIHRKSIKMSIFTCGVSKHVRENYIYIYIYIHRNKFHIYHFKYLLGSFDVESYSVSLIGMLYKIHRMLARDKY